MDTSKVRKKKETQNQKEPNSVTDLWDSSLPRQHKVKISNSKI